MTDLADARIPTSLFRIDRFNVPAATVGAFMDRVHRIQLLLDPQPGCRQNLVLTQIGEDGAMRVITVVEWENAAAMSTARTWMQRRYAEEGFDPAAFMRQLGVEADLGLYEPALPDSRAAQHS